jgi:lysophospholipase L1-like esterase
MMHREGGTPGGNSAGQDNSRFMKYPAITGILIAFVMFLILFSAAEILVRLFSPYPPPLFCFIKDRELGHFIRGSFYKRHFAPDGKAYDISTNKLGLFDKEYNGENPTVLLIGDSFTISAVPYYGKWGTVLEKKLNVRVIKGGVSAYGTQKEYILLRKLAPIVRPRIIILGHYINDYVDDYIGIDRYAIVNGHLYEKKTLDPQTGNVYRKHFGGYAKMLARHHIALFGFFSDKLDELATRHLNYRPEILEFDPTLGPLFDPGKEWTKRLYDVNFRNIMNIRRFADEMQAELVVLIIPAKEQVSGKKWKEAYGARPSYNRRLPLERILQFLEKNNLHFINLADVFEKEIQARPPGTDAEIFFYENDIHLNNEGDRLVADSVSRFIKSRGLLAGGGSVKRNPDVQNEYMRGR